ncbi:MAG: hypothetical protein EXS10_01410 [Phycisphaerales bacterium]|nr:hypothetical protein [Phycisphaerales bacterium]
MAKNAGSSKGILIALAILSAFLFLHTFGVIPIETDGGPERWISLVTFAIAAIVFGKDGLTIWCGGCAALAVTLNPIYPLTLDYNTFFIAKVIGGAFAGAAVIRNW